MGKSSVRFLKIKMSGRIKLYSKFVAFAVVFGTLFFGMIYINLKTPSEISNEHIASSLVLLDRHGQVLESSRVDFSKNQAPWVEFENIPQVSINTIIQMEDRRFWLHPGTDPLGLLGSLFKSIQTRTSPRGASTLAMQAVRLVFPRMRNFNPIVRKVLEWAVAPVATLKWGRRGVLEVWYNLVPLPGGCEGMPCAVLDHEPQDEKFLKKLVKQARSPGIYSPLKRKKNSETTGDSNSEFAQMKQPPLLLSSFVANKMANRADQLGLMQKKRFVQSSLDFGLQSEIKSLAIAELKRLREQNLNGFSVVVLENKSGHLVGFLGGSPYIAKGNKNTGNLKVAQSTWNNSALSKRQAGSTLKPFLYEQALRQNLISQDTLLQDTPLERVINGSSWSPQNYNKIFHGPIAARIALASSLNVPAVRVGEMVGLLPFASRLESLGFSLPQPPESYGASLFLGSLDVSLLELTQGYLKMNQENTASVKQISQILSSSANRALSFGWDSPLELPFKASVKTGTSVDMRDNWCIGFNETHTVGVWAGNEDGSPMWDVSGVEGAAPLWHDIFLAVQNKFGGARPQVLQLETEIPVAQVASNNKNQSVAIRIIHPADGSTYALDPTLSQEEQKLLVQSNFTQEKVNWVVNGVVTASAAEPLLLKLQRGVFEISLANKTQTLDTVKLRVK